MTLSLELEFFSQKLCLETKQFILLQKNMKIHTNQNYKNHARR